MITMTTAPSIDEELDSNLWYLNRIADRMWEEVRFNYDPWKQADQMACAAREAARVDRAIRAAEMCRYDPDSSTYDKHSALADILQLMAAQFLNMVDYTRSHPDGEDMEVQEAWRAHGLCRARLTEVQAVMRAGFGPHDSTDWVDFATTAASLQP